MLIIAFILPLLTIAILYFFFKKEVALWESAVLILSSVVFTLAVYLITKDVSQNDTEYYGGYVKEIRHYDEWNELQRRTRTYPCGKSTCTQVYYVTVTHPQYWSMTTNLDGEHRISEETFNKYKKHFNTPEVFIDMHRPYYTKDGDAQVHYWDKRHASFIPYAKQHRYKNPVKHSNSIFRYSDIDKDSAKVLGLFEYPEVKNCRQRYILGCKATQESINQIDFVNGVYGKKYEFHTFILVFPAEKGEEISDMQKGYWQGGNKNELIVCLGVDSTRHVKWCNAFSWSDTPWLDVQTRSWFTEHDSLDIYSYGRWLEKNVPKRWERKHFSDFNYIHSELTTTAKIIILVLTFVFCLGMSIWLVTNDYDENHKIGN